MSVIWRGFGRVVLPFALDRKFPNASTEWRWQFLFPAARICRNPRFGPRRSTLSSVGNVLNRLEAPPGFEPGVEVLQPGLAALLSAAIR